MQTSDTTYSYNIQGAPIKVTDPSGNVRTQTYDSMGRNTQVTDPENGTTQYTYDGAGHTLTLRAGAP